MLFCRICSGWKAMFCWVTAEWGSPSHVKSGVATSWMGISFRKAGFWQRGFPLTTRVFFSHWPSQARWQSHTYGLDSRLLWKTDTQVKLALWQHSYNTDLELSLLTLFNNLKKCILVRSKLLFTEQFSECLCCDKSAWMLYGRIYFGWETCIIMWILGKSRRIGEREKKERLSAVFIHLTEYTRDDEREEVKVA